MTRLQFGPWPSSPRTAALWVAGHLRRGDGLESPALEDLVATVVSAYTTAGRAVYVSTVTGSAATVEPVDGKPVDGPEFLEVDLLRLAPSTCWEVHSGFCRVDAPEGSVRESTI